MGEGGAPAGRRLEYTVSMKRAESHYFDVTLRVPAAGGRGPLRLTMPVWTPGHYIVEDFSRNVVGLRARTEGGAGARVEKEAKNVWRVDWDGEAGALVVEYSVYAFEYDDSKSFLNEEHAIINGAGVFVYPVGAEKEPARLRLELRAGWSTVATGLDGPSELELDAPSVDVLIDSPVEAGNMEVRSFEVKGVRHDVSMFGEAPVERGRFVDDLRRIVEAEVAIFGAPPYGRYVFLVDFTDEVGGGLEHLNSTVCFVPRLRLRPAEEYNLSMGLFSHEFFHAWNVKRMRPRALGPFDYGRENYTRSLWVAEGVTSYYDDLVLRRAGLFTVPEYLDSLAINFNLMKAHPGARAQSAQEASFDAWIKLYKPDANSPNVSMSYYTQGAVAGWMLDMEIRRATAGAKSLDDVMRRVYQETYARDGSGYTDQGFEDAASAVGGPGVKAVFDSRVRGREDVDFDRYLGCAGLRLEPKEGPDRVKGFLGVRAGGEGGRFLVKVTLAGSPAEAMGLSPGDELIAADGLRLAPDRLSFYLATASPGTRVRLTIARGGVLKELAGELGRRPPFEFRIAPLKEATEEQKRLFKGWLLDDWRPELKYPDYQRSPDRKSLLDYF